MHSVQQSKPMHSGVCRCNSCAIIANTLIYEINMHTKCLCNHQMHILIKNRQAPMQSTEKDSTMQLMFMRLVSNQCKYHQVSPNADTLDVPSIYMQSLVQSTLIHQGARAICSAIHANVFSFMMNTQSLEQSTNSCAPNADTIHIAIRHLQTIMESMQM